MVLISAFGPGHRTTLVEGAVEGAHCFFNTHWALAILRVLATFAACQLTAEFGITTL